MVMDEKVKEMFEKIGKAMSEIKVEEVDLGFNAFELMSDIYYRENFHSDVIKEILNPKGEHGQGVEFLRLFVEYLIDVCDKKSRLSQETTDQDKETTDQDKETTDQDKETTDQDNYYGKIKERLQKIDLSKISGAKIYREKGRTDIKISHKDPEWTILIENKINNAPDMKNQIPHYLDECKNEKVVAVVYLKPYDNNAFPTNIEGDDKNTQKKMKEDVEKVLIPIAGYHPGGEVPDLSTGWLDKCEFVAEHFDAKSVLGQFSKLVKRQAGDVEDMRKIGEGYKIFNEPEYKEISYSQLKMGSQSKKCPKEVSVFVDKLPRYLAEKIVENFRAQRTIFQNPFVWSTKKYGEVAALDGFYPTSLEGNVRIFLDVGCSPKQVGDGWQIAISIGARPNNVGFEITKYADKNADQFRELEFSWGANDNRLYRVFDANAVYKNIDAFIKRLREIINGIAKVFSE